MRKLLLTFFACMLAIIANAGTIYLVGSGTVDGKSLPGSPNGSCLAVTSESNVYTFTVNNVGWLKISDTNATDWVTFNKNGFTIEGKSDYAIKTSELGQTFKLYYGNGSSEAANNINPPSSGEYIYTLTVGTKGSNNSSLVVTTNSTETVVYDIYLRGSMNDYGSPANYKFTPDAQGVVYTLEGVTLSSGTKFKIADANWGAINYGGAGNVVANQSYKLTYNGSDMTLVQDISNAKITFNLNTEEMYIDDPSAEDPGEIEPDYSGYWVHVGGAFNSNDFYNNGVQPVDKIATFENLEIGKSNFKIHVWNGSEDLYYVYANESNQVPTGEWAQFALDTYDIYDYIAGAPTNGVYNIKYNVADNQIYIEFVSGDEEEAPDALYFLGNVNGDANWALPGLEMNNEGDGIFTLEDLAIVGSDGEYGYFALTSSDSDNWDDGQIGANRYGPLTNDTEVTIPGLNQEVELDFKKINNTSWKVPAGIYNVTVSFEDMLVVLEKTADYSATPATLESLNPENGGEINFPTIDTPVQFTATFTAPVKFAATAGKNNAGGQMTVTNEGGEEYAKVWTATFPAEYVRNQVYDYDVEGGLDLGVIGSISAENTDGTPVLFNDLESEQVSFILTGYTGEYGAPFEIVAPTETVASVEGKLETFTVATDEFDYITNKDLTGITITGEGFSATAKSAEQEGEQCVVTFSPFINAPGSYTITIPNGAFAVGNNAGEGSEGDIVEGEVSYRTEAKAYTFTILAVNNPETPEESGDQLVLDNNLWYPAANTKYYYKAEGPVTLKWAIYSDGTELEDGTGVLGGLYNASDDELVNPTSMNEGGRFDTDWNFYMDMIWAEYSLEAGEYYFTWSKNTDGDEYALYVTVESNGGGEVTPPTPTGNVIELNKTYALNANSGIYTYTCEETGILTVATNDQWGTAIGRPLFNEQYFFFNDENLSNNVPLYGYEDGPQGWIYKFAVTAGNNYYVFVDDNNTYNLTFTLEPSDVTESVAITGINVEPGTVYLPIENTTFVMSVINGTADNAQLLYIPATQGEAMAAAEEYTTVDLKQPGDVGSGTMFQVYTYPANPDAPENEPDGPNSLVALVRDGKILNGSDIKFVINGMKSNGKYITEYTGEGAEYVTVEENGKVTITYKIDNPITVESCVLPDPFYQQFPAGSNATATVTFSGAIDGSKQPEVQIYAGNFTPGSTGETIPTVVNVTSGITISGNTLTVDFSGINMSSINPGTATFFLFGVYGENGLMANTNGAAWYKQTFTMSATPEAQKPEQPQLVFPEDLLMTVYEKSTTADEITFPININVKEEFEHFGVNFGIDFPEWVEEATLELNEGFENGNVVFSKVTGASANRYMAVLRYDGTEEMDAIANITIKATYSDELESGMYDMKIVNPIYFSVGLAGSEELMGLPYSGEIELEVVPQPEITAMTLDDVVLALPSYDARWNKDEASITWGEILHMTVSYTYKNDIVPEVPAQANFTATVDGEPAEDFEVVYDEDLDIFIVNTGELPAVFGEPVTVELTGVVNGSDVEPIEYSFELRQIIDGDANDSGVVTVADVVTIASYITAEGDNGQVEDASDLEDLMYRFDFPNADVDGSETIDTQDITETVDIIMGQYRYAKRRTSVMNTTDCLIADDYFASDRVQNIGVGLDNTNGYAALQATIVVPEGMTVHEITAGPRAAGHELTYRVMDNGKINVVIYSLSNSEFAETTGALFNIVATAGSNTTDRIMIERIKAADAHSNGYILTCDGGINLGSSTGINGLGADEEGVRYFTVDGIEVRNPEAGMILIRVDAQNNVEKVVVK